MKGHAMHHVGGGDTVVPTFVPYSEPKPKQTGLDWSKHRQPDPTPEETAAVVERRQRQDRKATRTKRQHQARAREKRESRCSCGRPKGAYAAACRPCADAARRLAPKTCACGAEISRRADQCMKCSAERRRKPETAKPKKPATPRRNPGRRPKPLDEEAIIASYLAGASLPKIAAALGVGTATVRRRVLAAGVELRDDRGRYSGGQKIVDDPGLVQRVRTLYESGLSQQQVGDTIGQSRKQVQRLMDRHGIKPREGQSGGGDTLVRYRQRLDEIGATAAQVRAWAHEQGLAVGVRGAIRADVLDAYEAAHP